MKCGVILTEHSYGSYIYGMGVIEMDYVSIYDVHDKITEMLMIIFNGDVSEINFPFNSTVEFVTGGSHPYTSTIYYKTTEVVI